ncbi:MAG: flagellar basal body-associated FliL family protein [Chitinispirillales bacterium]|jgi:flagellar basal body-associated protein FliL|nr:flagellar basal body-associated FliL family protein [Chitinispirillales bacterium]
MPEEEKKEDLKEKKDIEKPKAKSAPNIIIIIVAILAFQALVAFLVVLITIPRDKDAFKKELQNPDDTVGVSEELQNVNLDGEVILPTKADIVVNISGTSGERFLKVKIFVAYDGKKPENKNIELGLAKIETQLRSKINEYLSSLTLSQVSDRNAIANVRTALLPELNSIIPNSVGKLSNVYIEEFIIQ